MLFAHRVEDQIEIYTDADFIPFEKYKLVLRSFLLLYITRKFMYINYCLSFCMATKRVLLYNGQNGPIWKQSVRGLTDE